MIGEMFDGLSGCDYLEQLRNFYHENQDII